MADNLAPPEHLMTFHDADWATEDLALKNITYNWTRGPTAFGAGLFCFVQTNGNTIRIEMSPDKRWVSIGGSSGDPTWIYIPEPGEKYKTPDGSQITPGMDEMMRVTYNNDADPKSGLNYQYRVRRVAYLDDEGRLVKTTAYEDLKRVATMPLDGGPSCCGCCWCMSDEGRALKNWPQLPSHTVVKYAPPPPEV